MSSEWNAVKTVDGKYHVTNTVDGSHFVADDEDEVNANIAAIADYKAKEAEVTSAPEPGTVTMPLEDIEVEDSSE